MLWELARDCGGKCVDVRYVSAEEDWGDQFGDNLVDRRSACETIGVSLEARLSFDSHDDAITMTNGDRAEWEGLREFGDILPGVNTGNEFLTTGSHGRNRLSGLNLGPRHRWSGASR